MLEMGAFEAKTHFSSLLEKVEKGEQITITKHGRPVAMLVPMVPKSCENKQDVIDRIKKFRRQNSLGGLDWKALRDEGRR
ncbi:MAG: type II toxin-antitoxin system prevent-host-death family antitoxin [Candidatus Obscuribacterales bacterium]|nr:type II toxin-antitoxin system prevent-host-death family antitoxin [Candidatus Obscuribacterales bacterium]